MPKIVDHDQRRREIVHALWAVIYRRGIQGVTFQAVAAEAEVSVGRIQHYFSSKRELVLAGARAMVDASASAWRATDYADAHSALAALIEQPVPRTEPFRLGSAVWYAYLAASTADADLGALVRETVRRGFDVATQLTAELDGATDRTGNPLGGTGARTEAVRLLSLSNGLAQAVFVGALTAEEALAILEAELPRHRPS